MGCQVIPVGEGHPFPGAIRETVFTCDNTGCKVTLTDEQIIAAGGLSRMGWAHVGKNYYCPEHARRT